MAGWRRERGLTLVEVIMVVAILAILSVILASATGSSTNVARSAIEQADLEARLTGVLAVLRRELRGAGVRRLTQLAQSPRAPVDPDPLVAPNWQDGDILLWQAPVENPPGSGVFYDFARRQPFWGGGRATLDGWNELAFEPTDTLVEARYGVGGADLNLDGLTTSPPLRFGRLVRRSYGPGAAPQDLGAQVGPTMVVAEGVLDRAGSMDRFFAVTTTGSGEGVAMQLGSATTAGRGGTVLVDLSLLAIVREEGQTRVRSLLASGREAIRPRNVE